MDQRIPNIISEGKPANATESQNKEFLSLFHQSDIEFELKNHLLEDLNQTEANLTNKQYFDALFEKIWQKRRIELSDAKSKTHLLLRFAQLAAILVVGLFIGYFLNSEKKAAIPVYYTSLAPKGSISEMYLPDGTHIYLNSGSEIKYTIDGLEGRREIFLTGEAWFQVAKMIEKPFLVHTPFYDVQVTGTTFNVKAYTTDKEVITTLEEGSVHVQSSKNLKLADETVLKPGEQLVYNKELKNVQIQEVNTKWFTSWKDNKLVFINMSFKDLRILLERKYGVEIEIADQSIIDYHYDGTIKNETIIEVLEILKQTLPIQYHIDGQKIIIQKKEGGRRSS
ncbi:MAG: FecR family protein [Mariniphaga sp.]|nr:FecR family protein [Mariniphaga sp.]